MIRAELTNTEICEVLKLPAPQQIRTYCGVSTLAAPHDGTVLFVKTLSDDNLRVLNGLRDCFVVTQEDYDRPENDLSARSMTCVKVENSRRAMANVLRYIELRRSYGRETMIHESAVVHPTAQIGSHVVIEPFVYVGADVVIGDYVVLRTGAKIRENTTIGKGSIIGENAVVGGQGFGIDKDPEGNLFRIPHFGGVRIGEYVEIGALTTVVSGTVDPTVVQDYTKVDDHVHVAHNLSVDRSVQITAGTIFGGSVRIGAGAWFGLNSTVMNGRRIAEQSLIGMGTVLTKNIDQKACTYAGSPAQTIDEFRSEREAIRWIAEHFEEVRSAVAESSRGTANCGPETAVKPIG